MSKTKERFQTKEDVWGVYDFKLNKRTSTGVLVARGKEKCPIFKDVVPYKSVTAVCNLEDENKVVYWLDFVQGGDCISIRKELEDGKVALRADYQCW